MKIERIEVHGIEIGDRRRRRSADPAKVKELADSIARLGLLQPITVYAPNDVTVQLVAGLHRLEAAKVLEWDFIDAIFIAGDETDRELAEIAENLHRADLTALERDEQVARWLELQKLRQPDAVSVGGRGNKGGTRDGAKAIGVSEPDARRAVKVANLSDEAKAAAKEAGLDDNRAALLEAASYREPEKQVAALRVRGTLGTGENEWYTPEEYLNAAREVLGEFDLDPASSAAAQKMVCAKRHFTVQDDGLKYDWRGRIFLNPPYSQPAMAHFVAKLVDERRAGRVTAAIMLTHNYTDTAWFHDAAAVADAICFKRGRIRFYGPDGNIAAPTQGQAFFYFGRDVDKFFDVFGRIGLVLPTTRQVLHTVGVAA